MTTFRFYQELNDFLPPERRLLPTDRVAVYPRFEALNVTPVLRVREHPLRVTRFVADAHLGGLARLLRMAGKNSTPHRRYLGCRQACAGNTRISAPARSANGCIGKVRTGSA